MISKKIKIKKVFTKIETVFPAEIGWSSKKKIFTQIQAVFLTNFRCGPEIKNCTFLVQITASPSQLLIANPIGGAIFILVAKIGFKRTKNVVFCILFRPMGGSIPHSSGYRWELKARNRVIITCYSPSCFGQETAKEFIGLRVKLPLVYRTRWRLHTQGGYLEGDIEPCPSLGCQ